MDQYYRYRKTCQQNIFAYHEHFSVDMGIGFAVKKYPSEYENLILEKERFHANEIHDK